MKTINIIRITKHQVITICLALFSINSYCQNAFFHTWFNGSGNSQYVLAKFVESKDSSFILAGSYAINATSNPIAVLINCNEYGDSLYTYLYDTSAFSSIELVNDSAILALGCFFDWTKGFISATKINFITGDTIYCKYYLPGNLQSSPGHLQKCDDGGYIMQNFDAGNYGFIKLDSSANIQWHKNCNMGDAAWQIKPDPSGGYVAVGNHGYVSNPYAVQRLDSAGNIIWSYGYGNIPSMALGYNYIARDVVITQDSNYLVTCIGQFINFMKINRNNGDTIWTKSFSTVSATLLNYAGNDTYITVTDSFALMNGNGDFIWKTKIYPNGFNVTYCAKTLDGGYAFCGSYNYNHSMVFVKLDSLGNTVNTSMYDITQQKQVYFYPNPVSDVLNYSGHTTGNFTFTVYNFAGSKVISVKNTNAVNVSALPSGFYFAEVMEREKVVREKFVKE